MILHVLAVVIQYTYAQGKFKTIWELSNYLLSTYVLSLWTANRHHSPPSWDNGTVALPPCCHICEQTRVLRFICLLNICLWLPVVCCEPWFVVHSYFVLPGTVCFDLICQCLCNIVMRLEIESCYLWSLKSEFPLLC